MVSSRSFFQVILRVLLMGTFMFGLIHTYYQTDLTVTPIMFGLLTAISFVELYWHLQSKERNWINFLHSVEYRDFTRAYKNQNASEELKAAYDLVTRSMEELQSGKEAESRLVQTLLRHVSTAVACFKLTGEVVFTNKAFNTILELPGLTHIDRLKDHHGNIYQLIQQSEVTTNELVETEGGQKLFVKTEQFKLKGVEYKLVSLTDIRNPLDINELESYEKLMRVMTHEIMNSATPILSLIQVLNKKLINVNVLNTLSEKDQNNAVKSLKAIEERTSGILKFVSAYRKINTAIKPRLQAIDSVEFKALAEGLMPSSGVSLVFEDKIQGKIVLDQSLIMQAVINLSKNAADAIAGMEDGKVRVELTKEEDTIKITVKDNGPGVSEKYLSQIFVPFYTTKQDGSGIGLALSRKIARAHGGTLNYSRVDKETVFSIVLPQIHN